MKPKSFLALLAVTAVITVAALITVADRYWIAPAQAHVQPFPGLMERINEVAEIEIQSDDGTTTIGRTESGWVMNSKGGYPVQAEKARSAVIGFAELELTERKTARADRYDRLGVGEPGGEDPKARLVTLKSGDGDALAELIVGKRRDNRLSSKPGYYVRRVGEEQSWFAPADFEIPTDPAYWLEGRVIHVNAKRVAEIKTVQPDGKTLVIAKETPASPHFEFPNLPPGKALKGEAVADDMDSIITAIDLVDVTPESNIDFSGQVWHTEVKTFDGLDIELDIVMRDQQSWVRLTASAGEPRVDLEAQPEEVRAFLKTPEEIEAEVAQITERTKGWAYKLQGQHGEKMKAQLAIFLEDETQLQSGGDGGLGGFGPGGGGPPPGMGGPPPGMDPGAQ